jgi:hypothetical protein
LIIVSKEESFVLKERFPDVFITVVNKQSKHKKRYVEETPRVLNFLKKYRGDHNTGKD